MRDVRDYKMASGGGPSRLGTASPFSIKLKSLHIGDFLDRYLDRVGLDSGVLVLFDRCSQAAPIEERTREERAVTPKGRPVRVLLA